MEPIAPMLLAPIPKGRAWGGETFVRAGGRVVGHPSGLDAPPSIVEVELARDEPPRRPRT